MRNPWNYPSFGVWRRIWMNEGCCFKRGSGNEGLGEKDCPSWFFFSLAFGQIIGCSLLHETLFFFHFFFTFEINSLVWSIYWKTFFFISFEALSKQHVWNFRRFGRGSMRWQGPTRELTQFDLVSGHQVCLGLPQLLMTWRKCYGLQKLTHCESMDWPQGTKCVWLPHLLTKGLDKLRRLQRFLWFEDLDWHRLCLICSSYSKACRGWNVVGTLDVAPSVTMMVRVKLPYLGINDKSYEWWNEATV